MALSFQKIISEVFVNGKFPKILPSKTFPLYGMYVNMYVHIIYIHTIFIHIEA